jgi:hypothetical protein
VHRAWHGYSDYYRGGGYLRTFLPTKLQPYTPSDLGGTVELTPGL